MIDANAQVDLIERSENFYNSRRRRMMRIALPLGFVGVILLAVLAVTVHSYRINRRAAMSLSQDVLRNLRQRVASEVIAYLSPAEDMVRLAEELAARQERLIDLHGPLQDVAMQILRTHRQLAMLNLADTDGQFLMPKKMPDGSIDTKLIRRDGESIELVWTRRDPEDHITAVEPGPFDGYDPRTRPWYQGAVQEGGLTWTDVYILFTDRKPGITASIPVHDNGGELRGVVGIDIELDSLCRFLSELSIGESGRALILHRDGRLVAHPDLEKMMRFDQSSARVRSVKELDDSALNRAFSRYQVEGVGWRELEVDGETYIALIDPLAGAAGGDWLVCVIVPERDFVGFVARNHKQSMLLSLSVVAVAAALAGLLVVQGLRADRAAQRVLLQQRQLEQQTAVLTQLASDPALKDRDDAAVLQRLTRLVCDAMPARRVSVWRLDAKQRRLVCEDAYDQVSGGHTHGIELDHAEFPTLCEAVEHREDLQSTDATSHSILQRLAEHYLKPQGCGSLLAITFGPSGRPAGSLWFEDEPMRSDWTPQELAFAHSVGALLASRFAVPAPPRGDDTDVVQRREDVEVKTDTDMPVAAPPATMFEPRAPQGRTGRPVEPSSGAPAMMARGLFTRRMRERGIELTQSGELCEQATVMVIRFSDDLSMIERAPADPQRTLADYLLCHLGELAESHGLATPMLLGDTIQCVAGWHNGQEDHAAVIADIALAFAGECSRAFSEMDQPMCMRIGIDTGAVVAGEIGRDHRAYHVWGEAPRTAAALAALGMEGAIQVSEETYRLIRADFLFQPRGTYFLDGVGLLRAYLLTSRL
jgi:class 3 adenylate cyclase